MSNRFDIKIGLEEVLEVDKVSEEIEEKKNDPDAVIADTEEEKTEEAPKEDEGDSAIEETVPETETTDLVKEAEDNSEQVADASDVAATLESIALCLEESLESGGLSQPTAKLVNLVTQDLYRKVGIKQTKRNTISVENFNTSSNKIRNTKIAIETIAEFATRVWEAIVDAITRSIEWIKKFIRSIFNDYEVHKKNIKKLRSALVTTQNDKLFDIQKLSSTSNIPQKFIFNKPTILAKLKAGGSFDFPLNIKELTKFSELFFDNIEKEQHKVINSIKNILDNIANSHYDQPGIVDFTQKLPTGVVKHVVPGYTPEIKTLESYAYTRILPGDSVFIAYMPDVTAVKAIMANKNSAKKTNDGVELSLADEVNNVVKRSKFTFGTDQTNTKSLDGFPVIPKVNILQLFDAMEYLCEEALKSEKTFDNFIKDKTSLQNDLKKIIKERNTMSKIDKVVDTFNSIKDEKGYIKKSKNFELDYISSRIQMIENTYVAGASKLSTLILQTLSASINYCSFCVDAYKAADR